MSQAFSCPAPLARFPLPVRDAYQRFQIDHNSGDLRTVVQAALVDFMPKRPGVERLTDPADSARLIEDLGFDSLAVAEVVFFFEDLFGVSIQNQDIVALLTVGDLHAFVGRKLAEQAPSA